MLVTNSLYEIRILAVEKRSYIVQVECRGMKTVTVAVGANNSLAKAVAKIQREMETGVVVTSSQYTAASGHG